MKKVAFVILTALFLFACGEDVTTKVIQAYSDGSKKTEADYTPDGNVMVAQRTYQENGKLLRSGPIKDDKRDGVWTFYDFEGRLQSKKTYSNGEYNGLYQEFYPNGNLKIEGQYENAERTGDWKNFEDKTKPSKKVTKSIEDKPFKQEKKVNEKQVIETFPDGSVKSEVILQDDGVNFKEQITYYENGKIQLKGGYKNNLKDGQWTAYYENGNVMSINNYKEDIFHGDYMLYQENGQVKIEGEYNMGKQTGNWKSYDLSGKMISHRFYDEDGNLLEEIK